MQNRKVLGIYGLLAITIAGVFSAKNLPFMAKYGFAGVFYYILVALLFFIPSALACAELATGFPDKGGIYAWVKAAFGDRFGFLAVWLEWTNTIVSFPASLSFIAATLAYIFAPQLADNKIYILLVTLSIFWGGTIVNLFGIKVSSWVSGLGVLFGALLPTAIIVILGAAWLLDGHPAQISFTAQSFMPPMHWTSAALLSGLILAFSGMQVAAFHAHEIKNPQQDYPRALLISFVVILLTSVLGSLAIAVVVPLKEIGLVTGIMQTAQIFFATYHLSWMLPLMSIAIVIGCAAAVNTWLIAPCKGLQVTAEHEHLPKFLSYTNRHGAPVKLLLAQAIVGTILSSVFLYMPSVNSSFWILTALTAILTFFMDILIFSAAIRLRYSKPLVKRAYKIPGGFFGVWLVCGVGALVCVMGIILGFIPPAQFKTGSLFFYEGFLVLGVLVLALPPFLMRIRNTTH